MLSVKERYKRSLSRYNQGLNNVQNKSTPKGQKFPIGSRVHIAEDLGPVMKFFPAGCDATVEYTYAHAYGGKDIESYSLIVDGHGSIAWYQEEQLTLI